MFVSCGTLSFPLLTWILVPRISRAASLLCQFPSHTEKRKKKKTNKLRNLFLPCKGARSWFVCILRLFVLQKADINYELCVTRGRGGKEKEKKITSRRKKRIDERLTEYFGFCIWEKASELLQMIRSALNSSSSKSSNIRLNKKKKSVKSLNSSLRLKYESINSSLFNVGKCTKYVTSC